MTEQEKLARQWAELVIHEQGSNPLGDQVQAAAEYILATLPEPNMADVEWDEDAHYLAGATTQYGSVVMLRPQGANMIVHDLNSDLTEVFDSDDVTPNGKRYELREVTVPEHPEVLTTPEDYENAPEGTVVAFRNGRGVEQKYYENDWRYTGFAQSDSDIDMCGTTRQVLRWGWGE